MPSSNTVSSLTFEITNSTDPGILKVITKKICLKRLLI